MARSKQSMQATFAGLKKQIETKSVDGVKDRLEDLADYAVMISPVSTGAYVNSFSIGKAGFGGGRSASSKNKPGFQDEALMKQRALDALQSDIDKLDIVQDLQDGNARFTLRNRSPHVQNVEDGVMENGSRYRKGAYEVFVKIKRRFS